MDNKNLKKDLVRNMKMNVKTAMRYFLHLADR